MHLIIYKTNLHPHLVVVLSHVIYLQQPESKRQCSLVSSHGQVQRIE